MTDLVSGPDVTAGGGNVVKIEPEAKLRMRSQIIAGAAGGERTDSPSGRSDVIAASAGGGPPAEAYARLPDQAALDFATWVAIASIRAGDRQS